MTFRLTSQPSHVRARIRLPEATAQGAGAMFPPYKPQYRQLAQIADAYGVQRRIEGGRHSRKLGVG